MTRFFLMLTTVASLHLAVSGCAAVVVADAAVDTTVFAGKTAARGAISAGRLAARGVSGTARLVSGAGPADTSDHFVLEENGVR